jgi:hypothetical protein
MTIDHTVVLFDITAQGYKAWFFPLLGCLYLVFALIFVVLVKAGQLPRPSLRVSAILLMVLLVGLLSCYATSRHYTMYRDMLTSGEASFVEGDVSDFESNKWESFTVNGVYFRYSDNYITEGFNNTSFYGGPIHQGLHVRIWYVPGVDQENVILKLEAQK